MCVFGVLCVMLVCGQGAIRDRTKCTSKQALTSVRSIGSGGLWRRQQARGGTRTTMLFRVNHVLTITILVIIIFEHYVLWTVRGQQPRVLSGGRSQRSYVPA